MGTRDDKVMGSRLQEFVHYAELKQLVYTIASLQQEKMFHSLAVLSFFPSEGKTLFCAAFAKAYSETRQTPVLIIDTTTFQNKASLILRSCLDGSRPRVEVLSLEELRNNSYGTSPHGPRDIQPEKGPSLEPEIVPHSSLHVPVGQENENDLSLIKKVTMDRPKKYGLILLDTTPLNAKNKSNIDPLVAAHVCDASVLVVSRKFLDAPNVNAALRVLEDPSLRLLGIISNEASSQ